jgi:hypothetical protein
MVNREQVYNTSSNNSIGRNVKFMPITPYNKTSGVGKTDLSVYMTPVKPKKQVSVVSVKSNLVVLSDTK